jgi:hypothetical protein
MTDQIELKDHENATRLSFVPSYHALNNEGKWQLSRQLHVGKSAIQLNEALEEARLIRAEGCEVAMPINTMQMQPDKPAIFATYEEPIEYDYKDVGSSAPNLNWVKAWLAKHKIGNRLPRGKAFNSHRHLESKADSQALGKLIIGSIKTALNFG